jgi:hypothetical protein
MVIMEDTKETFFIIAVITCFFCLGFAIGYLRCDLETSERHKEIISGDRSEFNRYDLHYITFGEKLKP